MHVEALRPTLGSSSIAVHLFNEEGSLNWTQSSATLLVWLASLTWGSSLPSKCFNYMQLTSVLCGFWGLELKFPQACAVFYQMSHSPSPTNVSKKLEVKLGTVAHAFNQEAELGRFLSLRPAMITEWEDPVSKQINLLLKKTGHYVEA